MESELLRPAVRRDHDRGRPVVQWTRIAGGHPPVFPERRLQGGEYLYGGVGPRPVVAAHRGTVRQRHGDDLAVEEPAVARLHGTGLALDGVAVHLLARDLLQIGDVLGRLPHRYVDVRILFGVPALEAGVLRVGLVGEAVHVARDTLDADGEEGLALAGLDGVEGHAAGLQRRGAVAVDGRAGRVETGE